LIVRADHSLDAFGVGAVLGVSGRVARSNLSGETRQVILSCYSFFAGLFWSARLAGAGVNITGYKAQR
jgi:hypothetical protein